MRAVLDHIGIAVKDLPAAIAFYRDALGLEIEAPEEVASQHVRAHFVPVGGPKLELLEATAPESAIARYIDKRGPGLHHITLRVDDIGAALEQLKARGARLVDERPRPGAEGALVAFVHPSAAAGVLVELKEAAVERGQTGIQRFAVGDLEAIALFDGFLRPDGGALFGTIPKPVWEKAAPADDRNRVLVAARPLVLRGVRTMLIDAGVGGKDDAAFLERHGIDRARSLDDALGQAGMSREDVDLVLATDLRFDHAGGFTTRDAAGRLRPAFPRARYVVRRGEWEDAARPDLLGRSSYIVDNYLPLAEAGVLMLVDDDQTIMPGVKVRRTGGPSRHHQIAIIESGGRRAAVAGHLIPTAAHAADAWIPALDRYPAETLAAKQRLAAEAIEHDMLVFFEHDPRIAAGYFRDENGTRRVVPARS